MMNALVRPIAAQMYTVRDASRHNFAGTLQRVAELGYAGVELAGTFDTKPNELANLLNDLGLHCVSAHVSLSDLRSKLDQQIDIYKTLGADYLVCPWLPPEERGDEITYRTLAETLDQIGEQCRANGLQLCYHHHDFELRRLSGRYALDILLQETKPENLQLEPDTYWLKYGGEDPAGYIARWGERVPLVHLKDMTATSPPAFAEVGTGTLDWISIFEAASAGNTRWYIVEQDICPGDPFESLRTSLENLHKMLE
jgi:sugar phosphate isomerase/epimerase